MRSKGIVRITAIVFCLSMLAGCSMVQFFREEENKNNNVVSVVKPVSELSAAEEHFVYITLDDCYPIELSAVSIATSENKMSSWNSERTRAKYNENATYLTYDEDLGGYGILLDEGMYEIRLICDAADVTYDQRRFIFVDAEHSYYHVRFTNQAYQSFD